MVLEVYIQRVEAEVVGGIVATGGVEVDLQRRIRLRGDGAIPPGKQVPARVDVVQSDGRGHRWRQRHGHSGHFSRIPSISLSLGGEGIPRGEGGIGAESAVDDTPVVLAIE